MMTTNSLFLPTDRPLINALTYCANCNKEAEPFKLRMCTACRSACYCDVACQKAHRKNHKHQCNKDVQLLQGLKENSSNYANSADDDDDDDDEELFQPIPPQNDCPICILPLSIDVTGSIYSSCCGNFICCGCYKENMMVTLHSKKGQIPCCPFCRESPPTSENENLILIKKRMEMNDSNAIFDASQCYKLGVGHLPKDPQKAFDLCLRAAALGNSDALASAATYYNEGLYVSKDMAKVREYLEMSAKKGNMLARFNLGGDECTKQNYRLASRHWLISAAAGCTDSLEAILKLYKFQVVSKKELSAVLASYRKVHKDEWSNEREAAAALL